MSENQPKINAYFLNKLPVNFDEFYSFVQAMDNSFSPPLSQRIDLRRYAHKLFSDSITVVAKFGDDLVGGLSFYCDPDEYNVAFISFIAVSEPARGLGCGNIMINTCINYVIQQGMRGIITSTWQNNEPMIGLLNKVGFKCVDTRKDELGRPTAYFELIFA